MLWFLTTIKRNNDIEMTFQEFQIHSSNSLFCNTPELSVILFQKYLKSKK